MIAIDTNVLVYLFDTNEPKKQAIATSLVVKLQTSIAQTVLIWQVAAELLNCLRRWVHIGKITQPELEQHFDDVLQSYPLILPSRFVLDHSFVLQSRYSLSHWDSLLLAACIDAGVTTLYSEDLSHGMNYDTVKVINPFIP